MILLLIGLLGGFVFGWWLGRWLAFSWFKERLEVLMEAYRQEKAREAR